VYLISKEGCQVFSKLGLP